MRRAAAEQMPVAMLGHPARPHEVSFPRPARPKRLARGIDVQHDCRDLPPVRAVLGSVEQAQIGNQMSFVVARQNGRRRRPVGNVKVKRRPLHDCPIE